MKRTLHFIGCVNDGIPVAICLEHDLVTQAETAAGLQASCAEMIDVIVEDDLSEGLSPWDRKPPPDSAVAEFRDAPGSFEFTIEVNVCDSPAAP